MTLFLKFLLALFFVETIVGPAIDGGCFIGFDGDRSKPFKTGRELNNGCWMGFFEAGHPTVAGNSNSYGSRNSPIYWKYHSENRYNCGKVEQSDGFMLKCICYTLYCNWPISLGKFLASGKNITTIDVATQDIFDYFPLF